MEASAIGRAGHFAVAGIKVATVANREAVRFVGAKEVRWIGLDQGYERSVTVVEEFTVDRLEVHNAWILTGGDLKE